MAEAYYKERYPKGIFDETALVEINGAKAALAAIQEDYVLVRKEAVEVVDDKWIEYTFFDANLFQNKITRIRTSDNGEVVQEYYTGNIYKGLINKKDIVG